MKVTKKLLLSLLLCFAFSIDAMAMTGQFLLPDQTNTKMAGSTIVKPDENWAIEAHIQRQQQHIHPEHWPQAGSMKSPDATTVSPQFSSLGIRFSTRAGQQLFISLEPGITIPNQSIQFSLPPSSHYDQAFLTGSYMSASLYQSEFAGNRIYVGADATYALTKKWFIRGQARLDQHIQNEKTAHDMDHNWAVTGGFFTGFRF